MADQPKRPALPPGLRPAQGAGDGFPGAKPPGLPAAPKKAGVEAIKEQSNGLRGSLAAGLHDPSDHLDDVAKQLIKFHGIYQQDDRDERKGGKRYIFMVRSKLPGGRLTAEQYLVHEELADAFGDGTLRITTREDFQLHGIIKGDLQPAIRRINESLMTTFGACGDVVRNVVCCPVPAAGDPVREQIEALSQQLSDHLLPRTRAYHEIWIDGEEVYSGKVQEEPDPLYGKVYLPRKFKIGISHPGDNCVDVYTQDVGLVPVVEDGALQGFNLLVGGGLGMTHKKPDTFPRLADPLAFVTVEEALPVVEEIVKVQRDHGDRSDRRQSRLKYLVHRWGLDRFRSELEARLGYALKPVVETPPLELDLHLGWHEQGDGRWYLGLSVENGRVRDDGDRRLKAGLHAVVTAFRPGVRLTANQDILLTDLPAGARSEVEAILAAHGVVFEGALSNARKYAMACPAMPTCALAITEAERVLPDVIDRIEAELAALGLEDERLTIRMTGCPNGCARPYVADIGFVGRSLERYTIFLAGRSDGTRLNVPYKDLVLVDELAPTLRPLFVLFKRERAGAETFGDFCHRIGFDALQAYADTFAYDDAH